MDYITQEEYLLALAEELKYLNPKDATKVLQYYQTRINNALDYGEKEKDIIAGLPTPDEVAKQTYEAHGINYLAIRKKSYKRKMILSKIIDSLLSLIIIIAFIAVMIFMFKSLFKMGTLVYQLIIVEEGINKLISSLAVVGYMLTILFAFIYVVDLFYIILSNFLNNIVNLKNKDLQRKIFTFTITGLIEDKTNHHKIQLKLLVSVVIVTIFLMIGSFMNNGYVASTLNDTPSNSLEVVIDDNITNIKLDTAIANIYFKESTSNQAYLVYEYEINNHLNTSTSQNNFNIEINNASTYDIFGLFNEPTPIITFYIPNNQLIDMIINFDSGVIDLTDMKLNNLTVNVTSKSTISIVGSTLNQTTITGFNVNFAIHSSNIKEASYEASKGQFIIEEKAMINKLNVNNFQSKIKFNNSTINDLTITNNAGNLELDGITGNQINFTARTSQNYLLNVNYTEMNCQVANTCSLTINDSIADTAKIESNNAFIIIDNLIANKMTITSTSSELFLSNLGDKQTPTMELAITHYNGSKTEITKSNLRLLTITQEDGYVICNNNYIRNGILNLVKCNIVELIDLDGSQIELYLAEIETSITLDAKAKTELIYLVKDWDLISGANLIRNEDTINFKVEGEE